MRFRSLRVDEQPLVQGENGSSRCRYLFTDGRFDAAANRAYYAMFNAARVLLQSRGIGSREVKTHASVGRIFSKEFVLNGPFEEIDGRALRLAGETRNTADYGDIAVTETKAREVISSMERFIAIAERILGETEKP